MKFFYFSFFIILLPGDVSIISIAKFNLITFPCKFMLYKEHLHIHFHSLSSTGLGSLGQQSEICYTIGAFVTLNLVYNCKPFL